MSIRVALNHESIYRYDRPVEHSPHVVRLRPAPHCRTPVKGYSLRIEPGDHFINWQQDPFGNYQARLVFPEKVSELRVVVDLIADLDVINPFDFFLEPSADKFPFTYEPGLAKELAPYFEMVENSPRLEAWVNSARQPATPTIDYLVALNHRLRDEVNYLVRMEPGIQTCEQTLERAQGSCRDSAWLLVQILRHLGLAARFVSGYLIQLRPDEKPLDGPAGPVEDFTDLHAWTEVYVPGAGWIGLDPTSGLLAGEGHIPLACTPDPSSAAPITGSVGICQTDFEHANRICRLTDPPRPTKPYSAEEWKKVHELAHQVDQDLLARDVRLTMGGEPTFVGIDDRDADEWNVAALGPGKRARALELIRRLREKIAPEALLHVGQGKWYPGEPLPRWKFACFWRKDGIAVWERPELIADERSPSGHGTEAAERFIHHLADRLQVARDCVSAGLEDTVYYLWKEGTLPWNIDPLKTNTSDPLERKRLRRLLEQGLDRITGFALPLRRDWSGWVSSKWEFRRERMYLIPGDSPMGYRLPLDSLLYAPKALLPVPTQPTHFEAPAPLPDFRQGAPRLGQRPGDRRDGAPGTYAADGRGRTGEGSSRDPAIDLVRTAICVEPRDGVLYVFMPPLYALEDYLELITAIEATAIELDMPVSIEGEDPPSDPRIETISCSPDPGVLEVNTQPCQSWEEMTELTEMLYEEARLSRLTTTKFLVDGRQVGTGGGNHIVLGGPSPAESPLLRRPDLLRSLICFWQNHPSLSYMLSGLFVGPTSQMPRVDEARDENLYELETALRLMPKGAPTPPWIIDRLLRHHLVDITGNTHRTEFSIDKLYSPDSFGGRRGLVEFRALEMPPSASMSLAQQLLVRALVSHFWERPYNRPLVRWGTELHDRFMLPYYLWRDFHDVLWELRQGGYDFSPEWFRPHLEFRFPVCGSVQLDDIEVELRIAIEPWNVLGEETSSTGTARFVDSSIERLQVVLRGGTDQRHVLSCNGRRLPLRRTATRGEFVAGVRFRAWPLPSSIHPTVGVHAPLVFDLVDTWAGRSMGGCTYHVYHPGGRAHETMPVNEFEAEGRRLARFWSMGHTPGSIQPPAEEPAGDFPYLLDLLRPVGKLG